MRKRDALVAAGVAVLLSAALSSPIFETLQGLSIDTLFWLRYKTFGQMHDPASSPTVVIALDEETWRSDEFNGDPEVLWLPRIGEVLRAVMDGGAKVIGFDVIFPTSMERTLPGSERQYRLTLNAGARAGKIVLGKVQHELLPIAPAREHSIAVGNQLNLRSTNLVGDADDVIRRDVVTLQSENVGGGIRTETSMAVELAARATGIHPTFEFGTQLKLGDYVVPGSERNEFLINFDAGHDTPTYPLVDLLACARQGEAVSRDSSEALPERTAARHAATLAANYFREHFAGKVVMLGVIKDVEDRKVAAKRFMTGDERFSTMQRCATTSNTEFLRTDLHRQDIPGVYIHTAAVNSLLRHEVLHELPPVWRWLPSLILSLAAGLAAIVLSPIAAGLTLAAAAFGWTAVATVALAQGWSLPLVEVILAAGGTVALLFGYRFGIADRDKRFLRRSFSLYLAPSIVDRMIESERAPDLGGEQRVLSIFFSDLANFTTLSETMSPTELVAIMNAYLSAMTDIVEAHGGFVDKYIGDAIVAVFGAPHLDPDHALHAVTTALACCKRLVELNEDGASFLGRHLAMRIGINTGETLVGNIGSRRRFNYTVMGDSVNLASRLQDLNKIYGTTILVAEATVRAIGPALRFRRIDRVHVKGRHQEVEVYTPGEEELELAWADATSPKAPST